MNSVGGMELHKIGLHNYCMLIASITMPIRASTCPINNTCMCCPWRWCKLSSNFD